MTERKPAGMSFGSWIDEQISEAAARGAFDNLPGAGKPLPKTDETDAGQAWLRDYLRREGVSTDELLPTPLKLRKEIERLADTVPTLPSAAQVREVCAELNERIMQWRRIPVGPPIFVPLVDVELMVGKWRLAQPEPGSPSASQLPAGSARQRGAASRKRRWRRPGHGRRT